MFELQANKPKGENIITEKNTDRKMATKIPEGMNEADTAEQVAVSEFTEITTLKSTYFFNWLQKIKRSSDSLRQNKEEHSLQAFI